MPDKSVSFLDLFVKNDKDREILAEFRKFGCSFLILSFNGHNSLGSTPEERWFKKLKRRPNKSLGQIMSRRDIHAYILEQLARCTAKQSRPEFLARAEKFQKEISYLVKIGRLMPEANILASKLTQEPKASPEEAFKALKEVRLELFQRDGEAITARLHDLYGIEFKYLGPQVDVYGDLAFHMIEDPVTGTWCCGKTLIKTKNHLAKVRRRFNAPLP